MLDSDASNQTLVVSFWLILLPIVVIYSTFYIEKKLALIIYKFISLLVVILIKKK